MSKYLLAMLLLSQIALTENAYSLNSACTYNNNKMATVLIEYVCTTDEGPCNEKGSGFIISKEGYLLTNYHVVSPPKGFSASTETVNVRVGSVLANPVTAAIISRDQSLDLALVKLPPKADGTGWPTVTVGENVTITDGAPLMGIGYSSSDVAMIPDGMKTAHNTFAEGEIKPWWQTNLALNHGNSGGPIFGELGTVVGVAVALNETGVLITYVIPISFAEHYLELAEVEPQKYAACAVLPECRNVNHGIEKYEIDVKDQWWSEWHPSGYNRPAACNDHLVQLKKDYPNSEFIFLNDDEKSEKEFGVPRYKYYCEFQRLEHPIYKLARSDKCFPS